MTATSPHPRYCMHKMSFAQRFCVCKICMQTWELMEKTTTDEFGRTETFRKWVPIDEDYRYRGRPKPNQWKKRGKRGQGRR